MSSFLAFIAISLKFVRGTESVRQTSSKEMAKMPKKEGWSKLKITVIRKLDWGTLPNSLFFSKEKLFSQAIVAPTFAPVCCIAPATPGLLNQ